MMEKNILGKLGFKRDLFIENETICKSIERGIEILLMCQNLQVLIPLRL